MVIVEGICPNEAVPATLLRRGNFYYSFCLFLIQDALCAKERKWLPLTESDIWDWK